MSHPDHETRVLAHRVFSIVLIPSLSQPWSIYDLLPSSQAGNSSMMSQKVSNGNKSILETINEDTNEIEDNSMEDHVKPATESVTCGNNDASTHDGKTVRWNFYNDFSHDHIKHILHKMDNKFYLYI